ncbi:DNA cytosine methyltransferase [Hallerella succinigenes]|uniref:DNA (cytosine-5-)-methyltransferase n=1 Tax=Hallerella succinigenes TaxID=1896222 RepID=A0A2M9A5X4_9BACT|nr:DNA cytosine methyltransferase [Hallerella succinigenes]PJJ41099.1 DNA (cytosine-5)-methyltransferase 1 [Hallerella succinigenes]
MTQKKSFLKGKKAVAFLDLFAGAGGISEGFLQSYTDEKYYDFILASDINSNCELTHRARYNNVLGLDTDFLCEDIMSETFVEHLKKKIGSREIDVVTGGPSCQSFSLSGRRRKYDKRDNLFEHYLKVITELRPKYFVMENVKGILTKDHGRFKDEIMSQIRSIIDITKVRELYDYLNSLLGKTVSNFEKTCLIAKVRLEIEDDSKTERFVKNFFDCIEEKFKEMTRGIDYRASKSDANVATIRHGISLLKHSASRNKIRSLIIQEKSSSDIDNDAFVDPMNKFIESLEDDSIVQRIVIALENIKEFDKQTDDVEKFKSMLRVYAMTLDECFVEISKLSEKAGSKDKFDSILDAVRLYRIDKPIVVLSSNYGVPQNRERVLFIGCRNDQELITNIPATVSDKEKVTVYEAISDLDFIGNGETCTEYGTPKKNKKFDLLVKKRDVAGPLKSAGDSRTYAEWSREGRLEHRFVFDTKPFYVKNNEDLANPSAHAKYVLFNHQTSSQNPEVKRRLEIIAKHGDYDDACKAELKKENLESNKRNYTVLNPTGQSPTVVTMPDDFVHYSEFRAMTVREMARLQSFDDSFVFQGKRQTGGDKRKSEIPQYTLVGNAVPPLMARAIGNVILKSIK